MTDRPQDQPLAGDAQYPQYPQYPHYPQYPQYSDHPQYSRYDQHPYAYPMDYGYPHPYASAPASTPPPPVAPTDTGTGRSLVVGFAVALAATALVLAGVLLTSGSRTVDGTGAVAQPAFPAQPTQPGSQPGNGGSSSGNGGGNGSGGGAVQRSGPANATQQIGIVTILTTLKYQNAQSAGTGMVLTADGKVLTNNHVIRGATSIEVTVESTGRSYPATVVGTAPGSDVAMIKLQNASGLRTAKFAPDADGVQVGDNVVGVGNGGGTGRLTAAAGKVTALNRSITASDETGQDSERLTGLIEVNAKIISGDSGGPLYDASGRIVGMNTAASSARSSTSPTAYAIPIDNARGIVDQIDSGVETTEIRIGYPGFLGVTTQSTGGGGATVYQVVEDGPADNAGIGRGDVITRVDGKTITSPAQLSTLMKSKDPGAKVDVTWTSGGGSSRSATITLITGPAD